METKKKCQQLIDACFSDVIVGDTGNKLIDLKNRAENLDTIVKKGVDLCVDYLNTINPVEAKEFAKTGFINYVIKKQSEFLGL